MCFFRKRFEEKNKIRSEILSLVIKVQDEYFHKMGYDEFNPDETRYAYQVFIDTVAMINKFGNKTINKEAKKPGFIVEHAALNFIANTAMIYLMQGDVKDVIMYRGITGEASQIYRFINDKKLKMGYITQVQYDENKTMESKALSLL